MLCLGILNAWALSSTVYNATTTGQASELIGSDHTTVIFMMMIFITGNITFNTAILTPIYVLVNVGMLYSVYDEEQMKNNRNVQTVNIVMRFTLLAFALNFAHYLVILQEIELFLEKNVIKLQQK